MHHAREETFGIFKKSEQGTQVVTSIRDSDCVHNEHVKASWLRSSVEYNAVYVTVGHLYTIRKRMEGNAIGEDGYSRRVVIAWGGVPTRSDGGEYEQVFCAQAFWYQ